MVMTYRRQMGCCLVNNNENGYDIKKVTFCAAWYTGDYAIELPFPLFLAFCLHIYFQ